MLFDLYSIFEYDFIDFNFFKRQTSNVPCWRKKWENEKDFFEAYEKECDKILLSLEGDLDKVINSGKSLVVEGSHLHPKIIKKLFERFDSNNGILIPYFLNMEEKDHNMFIEQWINSIDISTLDYLSNDFDELMKITKKNFFGMKQFLKDNLNCSDRFIEIKVDFESFTEVLDEMHSKFLNIIEQKYAS